MNATLDPRGTAAARFGAAAAADAPGDLARRLAAAAREHDLGDESLYLAEELVRLPWSLGERQQQALCVLVVATMISARQGSTRLPLDPRAASPLGELVRAIARAADLDATPAQLCRDIARLAEELPLDGIVGRAGEYRPLVVDHGCVYQHRMWWCETSLAARLSARAAAPALAAADDVAAAMADIRERPARPGGHTATLTDEQTEAVLRAARSPLCVVSGGPGTGKTAVVVSIVRALVRLGTDPSTIALAAPTGKAAHRLHASVRAGLEAIHRPSAADLAAADVAAPRTLHRLLGYLPPSARGPGRYRHDEDRPLPAEAVIVDEASMVDLALAERLVRALPPGARLVLLGDAEQLPSVDAGAVLRDLVASDTGAVVRLTRSFRMDPRDPSGRAVLVAAGEIGRGEIRAAIDATTSSPDELTWRGVEHVDVDAMPGGAAAFAESWYRRRVLAAADVGRLGARVYRFEAGAVHPDDAADLAALHAAFDRTRILTVTRRGPRGSEALCRHLHERILADATVTLRPDFYPGEPVIMRANDYERGLYNGDQGLIVRASEDGGAHRFRVVFPSADGWALYHVDALRPHMELAFALTVHKAQGSELDEVAVVLPPRDMPLCTREMLYTALTRARHGVVLAGSRALLRAAARRAVTRHSGLADRLRPT